MVFAKTGKDSTLTFLSNPESCVYCREGMASLFDWCNKLQSIDHHDCSYWQTLVDELTKVAGVDSIKTPKFDILKERMKKFRETINQNQPNNSENTEDRQNLQAGCGLRNVDRTGSPTTSDRNEPANLLRYQDSTQQSLIEGSFLHNQITQSGLNDHSNPLSSHREYLPIMTGDHQIGPDIRSQRPQPTLQDSKLHTPTAKTPTSAFRSPKQATTGHRPSKAVSTPSPKANISPSSLPLKSPTNISSPSYIIPTNPDIAPTLSQDSSQQSVLDDLSMESHQTTGNRCLLLKCFLNWRANIETTKFINHHIKEREDLQAFYDADMAKKSSELTALSHQLAAERVLAACQHKSLSQSQYQLQIMKKEKQQISDENENHLKRIESLEESNRSYEMAKEDLSMALNSRIDRLQHELDEKNKANEELASYVKEKDMITETLQEEINQMKQRLALEQKNEENHRKNQHEHYTNELKWLIDDISHGIETGNQNVKDVLGINHSNHILDSLGHTLESLRSHHSLDVTEPIESPENAISSLPLDNGTNDDLVKGICVKLSESMNGLLSDLIAMLEPLQDMAISEADHHNPLITCLRAYYSHSSKRRSDMMGYCREILSQWNQRQIDQQRHCQNLEKQHEEDRKQLEAKMHQQKLKVT